MRTINHLHTHSSASLLDGAVDIEKAVLKTIENGGTGLAITDHGNMIKTFELQQMCDKHGIKPIIGCEFYTGNTEKLKGYHLIVLAKNQTGLQNLFKLQKLSYMDNFYGKPKITKRMLFTYAEGLIVTTACIGSEFGSLFFDNNINILKETLASYKHIFGDDFYIEIQPNNIPEQKDYNIKMLELANQLSVKCIVSCDAHYVNKEDSEAHDTLLAVQVKKKKQDTKRFKFSDDNFYMMNEEDIRENLSLYIGSIDIGNMIRNTHEIVEKCSARYEEGQYLPGTWLNPDDELKKHCNVGYTNRFGNVLLQEYVDRINYELDIICQKGYSGYFLIVEDFIRFAREDGILVGPGRGSAAGSLIAYILGITNVDPMKYGLLFERFLNPERDSMPDIDTDFDYIRRHEVIEYIKDKYGRDNVATIIAEGSFTCKNVMRKVLSTYDVEQRIITRLSKLVVEDTMSFLEALGASPELNSYMEQNPNIRRDIVALEGLMSHESKHAAGVVISPKPLDNILPVKRDSDDHTMLKCQFHKKIIEKLGLVKFDLLGLKTLSLLDDCLKLIKKNHNICIDLDDIDMEDPGIYEVMNSGELLGIFQFEGAAGKQAIEKIRPDNFNHLIAANALCRPGVKERDMYYERRNARTQISDSDIMEHILGETLGTIIYQEQTMLLMSELAGWSLGKADSMRKVSDLNEYKEEFVEGCRSNGHDEEFAESIFNRFSLEYSFNKSHAACYAVIAAQSAWLKHNYYIEFMTALLSKQLVEGNGKEIIPLVISAVMAKEIRVKTPNINKSTDMFECNNDTIFYPLSAIDGAGVTVVEKILRERANGQFDSLSNFLSRFVKRDVNKGVGTKLIKAGCFDEFNINRCLLLQEFFDTRSISETSDIYSTKVIMKYEMQTLGMYLTFDPLSEYPQRRLSELKTDGQDYIYGMVSSIKKIKDRNNNSMAFMSINTRVDNVECIMFRDSLERYQAHLAVNSVVSIKGVVSSGKFKVNEIIFLG